MSTVGINDFINVKLGSSKKLENTIFPTEFFWVMLINVIQ